MLVIRRHEGQGFTLIDQESGNETTVNTIRGEGNRLKFMISAPEEVKVIRNEKLGERQDVYKKAI